MEAAADGEGEESSSFRCADAARYAVASVVTILIVTVVVEAVMVLRPKPLYLSVQGGVFFTPNASQPENMTFDFTIQARNPSDHVQIYYTNVSGRVLNKTASTMFQFYIDDMMVRELTGDFVDKSVNLRRGQTVPPSNFDVLYEGASSGSVIDLTMSLDGTLITKPLPEGFNTTGRRTIFYCRPLLVVVKLDVDDFPNSRYTFCVSGGTPRRPKA